MDKVRVRFAPSPTGPLHIGGVRTALFNYLFARKHKGTFILRIEDTDQARFVNGAEEYILESLKWSGISVDEGVSAGGPFLPYRQSERKEIYIKYVQQLLAEDKAYYAFDTPEELEVVRKKAEEVKKVFAYDYSTRINLKNALTLSPAETEKLIKSGAPYVIRFKMPENENIPMKDIIRGDVSVNTSTLDDKVLFKSDGLPTYHMANVVDDYLMKITHVIRGEEWLPSLPLHVMLYKALGWENQMPEFAHLPLILKPSGKGKLSKRDGDKDGFPVFPLEWNSSEGEISMGYRESGYFPEAVVNMLAFLGWNPGTEQELFSMEELIKDFSLDRVGKAGARFDPEKAKWYNQQYLRNKPDEELAELFIPILNDKGIKSELSFVSRVCSLVKERAVFTKDLWDQSFFFFQAPTEYDEKIIKKFWKEQTTQIISDVKEILMNSRFFAAVPLEEAIKQYIEKNELGFGKVMNPMRLVLVGGSFGPHLFDIMEMIGKEETINRIEKGLKEIKP
ncbi:MAG: glutamate--tRNA ligase [Bacteroidales bacterium]|nr:glutamate--tRNA ligase [Bacteroidales bacterium]